MKKTDYKAIAENYDKNKYRQEIKQDEDLKRYIDKGLTPVIKVLDLACGTGIYLQNQINHFQGVSIEWHGLDASEEMLQKAKSKTSNCRFVNGLAEELPYDSDYFDFVINNYAFHHFIQKSEVLDEVVRALKKKGALKIHNISVHDMRHWWIYEFFPSAYFEDLKRFWPKDLIFNELSNRGFDVDVRNMIVMLLQISNSLSLSYARFIVLITGFILLLLDIHKVKKFRQRAGEVLFQLESEWRTSFFTQLIYSTFRLFMVVLFVGHILLKRIPSALFLNYSILVYVTIYSLYLDFFVSAFFTENGLFFRGKMIQWNKIKSYKWRAPRFIYRKGYVKLQIYKESRLWIDDLQLLSKDSQKLELDKLLQQKIGLSEHIG